LPSISGFMVVKDALKQGYPFVEAVASALPVCDELLVSDGYSTDGTFETLQKIASLNKKVKVFRNEWSNRGLTIIADVSNDLRKKCTSTNLFYIQAPEIVHEDDLKMLKALPELFPETETFCLPYTSVISNFKIQEEFRLRLVRNLDRINLTGDAWAFSVSRKFIRSEAMSKLKRPKKLLSYVGRGIEWTYAGSLNNKKSRAVYLPKPVFRYPVLFKENFIERCKGHAWHLNMPDYYNLVSEVQKEEGESFYEKAAQLHRGGPLLGFKINYGGSGIEYSAELSRVKTEEHPRIMREFITKGATIPRYYVRDSVLNEIANA
jgi:glycosyltransferase involved in cell wall biosynthesis